MCQRESNVVTEKKLGDKICVGGQSYTLVQKPTVTELERREEIDMRVGTLLAKREAERWQYQRGFWDAIYVICTLACIAYFVWVYMDEEK